MLAPVVCLEWVGDGNVSWLFNACLLKWPLSPFFNPNAVRKAKIVCNFCLSECNRLSECSRVNIYVVHISSGGSKNVSL